MKYISPTLEKIVVETEAILVSGEIVVNETENGKEVNYSFNIKNFLG